MESSANNNISKSITIRGANLNDPDKNTIAVVLEEELKRNYMEVIVEWVTSHPILSDKPFNLAAPGICGNTALLDFGDESYFHLPFTEMTVYPFEKILKDIHRDKSNSFIFGHGVYPSVSSRRLSEIVLNASFPPVQKEIESENSSSGLTTIETSYKRCKKRMLRLSKLECAVRGTFFLSEGLKTDEPVLKVYAKGPYSDKSPFCGSKRFIHSMQNALEQKFGSKNFVALGGVYTVNNVFWEHRSIRNSWEPSAKIRNRTCLVKTPETMITTFSSSKECHQINPELLIRLNSCQSIHSLTHHSASEKYPISYDHNQGEEYVGYFCPAKTLYRIDEPPQ